VLVRVIARSVSRTIQERLHEGCFAAEVLAAFDHACDLLISKDRIVALVTRRVGDGPLNVVVDGPAGLFAGLEPGTPAVLAKDRICVGRLEVALAGATVWEPRPDWKSLRVRRYAAVARLPLLRVLCLEQAPSRGLVALLEAMPTRNVSGRAILVAVHQAASVLEAGWEGDPARLQEGAGRLAGLGDGLTPSGDDFLMGVMLRAWLTHPAPGPFCRTLVEAAADLTTTLSAAFLRAAGRGECRAAWHTLLTALCEGTDAEVAEATRDVLAHGATSGADALTGFLWARSSLSL